MGIAEAMENALAVLGRATHAMGLVVQVIMEIGIVALM